MGKQQIVVDTRMTANEKRGLEKVVRERFRLLGRAIEAQASSLKPMIEQKVAEQFAAQILSFKEEAEAIEAEAQALKRKADKLARKAAKAGLTVGGSYQNRDGSKNEILSFSFHDNFESARASALAEGEYNKLVEHLKSGARKAGVGVEMKQSKFLELIWLDGVTSDAATDFLDKIPSLDDLVAEAAGHTHLLAAGK